MIPGIGHKTSDDARRSHVKKTQTAARETGTPAAEPARSGHTRNTARTEASAAAAGGRCRRAAAGRKGRTGDRCRPAAAAAKAEPATAAVTPPPPASSPKPAPKTDGPGYANGVPINPLD